MVEITSIGTSPTEQQKMRWGLKEIAEVKSLIDRGLSRRQTARAFNEKYGTQLTKSAVGKAYWRYVKNSVKST